MVADGRSQGGPIRAIDMIVAPTAGDHGEMTFDVVGLGDDAASGLRLLVFVADEDGTWILHAVESTVMCQSHRGEAPGP